MSAAAMIAVDWGTTSLRCALLGVDGAILAQRNGRSGILSVKDANFAGVLFNEIGAWQSAGQRLPTVLSGMIGSRQGWVDVPYLPCPAGPRDLAGHLYAFDGGSLGVLHVVPGLMVEAGGAPPDVMRGEETQVIGALDAAGIDEGLFVLPGTHSKWTWVSQGAITGFQTYMTGEVFAVLRDHSILGRLMIEGAGPADDTAFDLGVMAGAADGAPGTLLNRIFSTRTLGLFERLASDALESYLSGLLIGSEVAAAVGQLAGRSCAPTIIGSASLCRRYERAASILKIGSQIASGDCAARGAWTIARIAGLMKDEIG